LSFTPPEPEYFTLSNGMKVIFMEDSELPLVSGVLYIPGGTLWEDPNTPGVVSMMGSQMRAGGIESLSADELDYRLQELSASVSSSFGSEYGSIGFESLRGDFDEVFSIFAEVVLKPRFETARLELLKSQRIEGIRRRSDDPSTVASIAFQQLVFGQETPFGRVVDSEDVARINRVDLLRAHRQLVRADRGVLVVSGDITKDEVRLAAERYFGGLPSSPPLPEPPDFNYNPEPGIYFLEFPLQQATISIGQPGPARHSPDEPAFALFNDIFGAGGFNSRLLRRVRTDLGLAYWIGGGVSPGFVVGQNSIRAQTKSESAAETIREALNILIDMRTSAPTEQEIQLAQQALQGSFVFRFDSIAKVAHRRAILPLMGYPEDHDEGYLERIQSVGEEEILGVARRYWDLEGLVIVVVGDQTSYTALREEVSLQDSPIYNFPLRKIGFSEKIVFD